MAEVSIDGLVEWHGHASAAGQPHRLCAIETDQPLAHIFSVSVFGVPDNRPGRSLRLSNYYPGFSIDEDPFNLQEHLTANTQLTAHALPPADRPPSHPPARGGRFPGSAGYCAGVNP